MAKEKKEKKEKYWAAPAAEKEVYRILAAYPEKFAFAGRDIQVLFKDGKYDEHSKKKWVTVKIIKEPITLLTTKKAMVVITEAWWKDVIDSKRTKGLIEGLLTVTADDNGDIVKRDYDIKTFYELVPEETVGEEGDGYFGQFEKVLPGSAKLVLQS